MVVSMFTFRHADFLDTFFPNEQENEEESTQDEEEPKDTGKGKKKNKISKKQ
jgi:hypothetical protein